MSRLALVKVFTFLVLLCSLGHFPAWAAEDNAVSAKTFKVLEQSNVWIKQGKAKQAVQKLQTLQQTIKDNPFESAVVQQYLAYAYGEADNFWAARQAAKTALASKLLSADSEHSLHYLAGQIALHLENYRESAFHLQQWLKQEDKVDPEIYYMAGYAAYRANLPEAERLIEHALSLKKKPPEEWRRLLLALYIDRKQYSKAEKLVKKLLTATPKKQEWWRFLTGLYVRQGKHDQALATMMLAYYDGNARSDDVLQLVRFNAQQGYPAKAARLLEEALNHQRIPHSYQNLKLLFGCWQLAREWAKSREVLVEAAKLADSGEDFALLGRLEMMQGRWSQAKSSLQKGLKKGGLKRKQQARLWLGIAAFKTQDEVLARQSLQAVMAESTLKQEAAYWLKRLDRSKKSHQNRSVIPNS